MSKGKYIAPVIIAVLLVITVFAVVNMNDRYEVIQDLAQVKENAQELYSKGDMDNAIFQLQAYCNEKVTDVEARAMLGDWYLESGDEENAYASYLEAAKRKKYEEERFPSLTVRNSTEILTGPVNDIVIEITPDVRYTKDMTLMITGHNLVTETVKGKISEGEYILSEEEYYRTTDWFDVDPKGGYLTMSGGFNMAIWQFKDENGMICNGAESPNQYRLRDTVSVNVYQMARAVIPEDARACRVTYFDAREENVTDSMDEQLTIVYGRLPGESVESDYSYYEIPDLCEGEKIVYKDNEWTMHTKDGEAISLDWKKPSVEKGSYFTIQGTLPGRVSFANTKYADYSKSGIYTIQFEVLNPSATGQRLDDAKNLTFNGVLGEDNFTTGENHFDYVYPWSEIKLCAIKDGKILYSGESGFSTDGSAGDVFVEIPKFYSKRSVDQMHDTISISGEKHEGFEVDEAFLTENGEADKIYIAAYLTGEGFSSVSKANPILSLSPDEINAGTWAKGDGYREIDYAALGAVQKLFMVETGVRNSQYLFMGICAYSLPSGNKESVAVALSDRTKTNCIEVDAAFTFEEGNNIVLYNINNYDNDIKRALSNAKRITTVIDNEDGTQFVYFSGDPITVRRGVTAIAQIAITNGTTSSISYHTGATSRDRGTVAFKYRYIENLWGNAYVYIDKVNVKDGVVTLTDREGKSHRLSYALPEGSGVLDSIVNRVGYDAKHSTVMLPSLVGEGATISTCYGDSYFDEGAEGQDNVLYYGGAWNTKATAGLFSYMVADKEPKINATGRMMYIK